MTRWTWLFIAGCWIAWLVFWVIMAFTARRTVERRGFLGYRLVAGLVFVAMAAAGRLLHVSAQAQLWPATPALGVAAGGIVAAGVAFSVWARLTLGRNWSAEVTFKQDHELIESGPYGLVRHPIYTGLLLMALGTAINYDQAVAFAVFASLCGALWWKVRLEEQIMGNHFPDAYADYKARVRAIIPFVL
jgi:protein-S-isoprenylcysteine O-methyltransferase Ste14